MTGKGRTKKLTRDRWEEEWVNNKTIVGSEQSEKHQPHMISSRDSLVLYTALSLFYHDGEDGEDGDGDDDVDTWGQERGVFNETGRNCRCRGLITAPHHHHLPPPTPRQMH